MMTIDEVVKMLSDFQVKLESDKRFVKETEERWQSQRQHIEKSIRSIHKELQIGKSHLTMIRGCGHISVWKIAGFYDLSLTTLVL